MDTAAKYRLTERQARVLVRAWRHHSQVWSARGMSWDWSGERRDSSLTRPSADQVRSAADQLVALGLLARRQFSEHRHGYMLTDEGRAEAERRRES